MSEISIDLADRVALVTHAGTDTGRAIARALAGAGAAMGVHDVNPDRASQLAEIIIADGGRALTWIGDLSNRFQVSAMIEALRDEFEGLHVLVNVAHTRKLASILTLDEYDWRRGLDLNLTSTFFCTQLAARVMVEAGSGIIVNVGGVANPACIQPGSAAYLASQAGLVGLTRAAAHDLAERGVCVNVVCAGAVTPESNIIESMKVTPERAKTLEHIVATVLFLCSPGAALLTGQVFMIDGIV